MRTTKTDSAVGERLFAANNDFGFRLLFQLSEQETGKNVVISPLSVAIALAMTYNGAEGTTKQAMAEVMGLTELSLQEINDANALFLSMAANLDSQVQLAIANSIWVGNDIVLAPDFIHRSRHFYASEIANLDFSARDAANIINQWVTDKTHKKIEELVKQDIISTAILLLLNAIYFKGLWTRQFDKAKTKDGAFTLLDGTRKQHPMMSQSGHYDYYENENFQAVCLPYGEGRISMYIFLPKSAISINEFQKSLNIKNWQRWLSNFRNLEGDIVMPRFKVEYGAKLRDALTALGMGVVFNQDANFEGIGTGSLMISNVIHKTFVEVNEEGTEAAAATAVIVTKALIRSKRFSMTVNRPFFCAIRDKETGAILFMGLIAEPT